MYFKLNNPQKDKYTDMGMLNVSASFYLEKGDEGWEKYQAEHHVIAPIIPEDGYKGELNKNGIPVDRKDYDDWIKSLPTEERDNPFCTHAMQFEPDATEEEILWCFEWALALTHHNYMCDDLHCKKQTSAKIVNQDIGYIKRRSDYRIPDKIKLAKIANAESKVMALKEVDFTVVETIANYKVK